MYSDTMISGNLQNSMVTKRLDDGDMDEKETVIDKHSNRVSMEEGRETIMKGMQDLKRKDFSPNETIKKDDTPFGPHDTIMSKKGEINIQFGTGEDFMRRGKMP